jgi:hypothetical protein
LIENVQAGLIMRCMMARGVISIVAFDPDNGAVHDNNIIIVIKNIIVFKNPSTTIDTISIADLRV